MNNPHQKDSPGPRYVCMCVCVGVCICACMHKCVRASVWCKIAAMMRLHNKGVPTLQTLPRQKSTEDNRWPALVTSRSGSIALTCQVHQCDSAGGNTLFYCVRVTSWLRQLVFFADCLYISIFPCLGAAMTQCEVLVKRMGARRPHWPTGGPKDALGVRKNFTWDI